MLFNYNQSTLQLLSLHIEAYYLWYRFTIHCIHTYFPPLYNSFKISSKTSNMSAFFVPGPPSVSTLACCFTCPSSADRPSVVHISLTSGTTWLSLLSTRLFTNMVPILTNKRLIVSWTDGSADWMVAEYSCVSSTRHVSSRVKTSCIGREKGIVEVWVRWLCRGRKGEMVMKPSLPVEVEKEVVSVPQRASEL